MINVKLVIINYIFNVFHYVGVYSLQYIIIMND
jgi:hypothetical protein